MQFYFFFFSYKKNDYTCEFYTARISTFFFTHSPHYQRLNPTQFRSQRSLLAVLGFRRKNHARLINTHDHYMQREEKRQKRVGFRHTYLATKAWKRYRSVEFLIEIVNPYEGPAIGSDLQPTFERRRRNLNAALLSFTRFTFDTKLTPARILH